MFLSFQGCCHETSISREEFVRAGVPSWSHLLFLVLGQVFGTNQEYLSQRRKVKHEVSGGLYWCLKESCSWDASLLLGAGCPVSYSYSSTPLKLWGAYGPVVQGQSCAPGLKHFSQRDTKCVPLGSLSTMKSYCPFLVL